MGRRDWMRTGRRYGPKVRLRRRNPGFPYVAAVQFVAVVAAVLVLSWMDPDWWDYIVAYLEAGYRLGPVFAEWFQ